MDIEPRVTNGLSRDGIPFEPVTAYTEHMYSRENLDLGIWNKEIC